MGSGVLVRLDSKARGLEEEIKGLTQRFDVAIVFKLSLANKNLSAIPTLGACINLLDLNLQNNSINRIDGLETLPQLKRLNLSSNHITKLSGLSALTRLEYLALHDNRLESIASLHLHEQLRPLVALRTLYLQQLTAERPQANPCCREPGYKATILTALPLIANLDGERNPGNSTYADVSREMEAAVQAPVVRPEPVIPPVDPWLDVNATQPDEDSATANADPQVDKQRQRLAKTLQTCHDLMDVFAKEVEQTRTLLQTAQPG